MAYLIAKKYDERGCIALKAERGKELANLVSWLGSITMDKGIQILTVSDMEMFGEYRPYRPIDSKDAFIASALSM